MRKKPYLPKGDNEKRAWLINFSTQLAVHGSGLGITDTEITATRADARAVNYILDILDLFKKETQERTSYKDLLFEGKIGTPLGDMPGLPVITETPAAVPAGVFKRIAKIVQRIKNHPDYNEAIGKNLGIIGAEREIDYENLKVKITLRRNDSLGVVIDFVKGQIDGVVIYGGTFVGPVSAGSPATSNESSLMIWKEIGRATTSPYIDTRQNATNQPENRAYKMRYLIKDMAVGKDSDIISVIAMIFPTE
jgi:hypothetical protein